MGVARMYKGDLKPSHVYEPNDVYELRRYIILIFS